MNFPIFFNASFDKNQLKHLIDWCLHTYGETFTLEFLEQMKYFGFHYATQAGVSLGVDDLKIPQQKPESISKAQCEKVLTEQAHVTGNLTSVEKSQRLIEVWNETSDYLRHSAVQSLRGMHSVNPVYMMAFSGARGNISQVRQLVAMRGLMADPLGAILEFPIQSNFREGLTFTEYFISCYGARKGLVDTALRTATAGYLTRRLVDAVQHVVVALFDCGTTKGIPIEGKNIHHRLIGRVLARPLKLQFPDSSMSTTGSKDGTEYSRNHIVSPPDALHIARHYTRVWVRSPLRCETYSSVCQLCYGWSLAHGKLVNLGEAIGVIAAQSIGEPGTQLTMRTFHTGGVGVFSENAVESIYAPFSGIIRFIQELPGRFVRTPRGKIAYFLQYQETGPDTLLFQLDRDIPSRDLSLISERESEGDSNVDSENSSNSYYVTESVLPPRSILFVKHGQYVQEGELLAQTFQTQSSTHVPIDYPVYALSPGEIRFEKIRISMKHEVHVKGRWGVGKIRRLIPPSRRLRGLGNFWVLNGHVFHYTGIGDPFFSCGDLVSSNTPASQCMLYTPRRGYIQILGSQPILTLAQFGFGARYVRFHTFGYSFVSDQDDIFLYHGSFSNRLRLTWYPTSYTQKTEYFFVSNFFGGTAFKLSQPISVIREKHLSWIRMYRIFLEGLKSFEEGVKHFEEGLKDFAKGKLEIPDQKQLYPGENSIFSEIAHVEACKLTSLSNVTSSPSSEKMKNVQQYRGSGKKYSQFLRSALESVHAASFQRSERLDPRTERLGTTEVYKPSIAQQKSGWIYIPSLECTDSLEVLHSGTALNGEMGHEMRSDVLQPGLLLENQKISFPKQSICFEFLSNKTLALYVSSQTSGPYSAEMRGWLGTNTASETILETKNPFKTASAEFRVLLNRNTKHFSKNSRLFVSVARNMSETTVFLSQRKKIEGLKNFVRRPHPLQNIQNKSQASSHPALLVNKLNSNTLHRNYIVRIPISSLSAHILSTTLCLVSPLEEIQTPSASMIYREWSKRVKSKSCLAPFSKSFDPRRSEVHTRRAQGLKGLEQGLKGLEQGKAVGSSRFMFADRGQNNGITYGSETQITNPLFTKQYPTRSKSGTRFAFSRHSLCSEGWNIANQTARLTLYLSGPIEKKEKTSGHTRIYTHCIHSNDRGDGSSAPKAPGFQSYIYKPLSFEPISQFPISVFPGHSITPEIPIARVSMPMNEQGLEDLGQGEFLRYTRQSNQFLMNILQETNICAFTKPKTKMISSSTFSSLSSEITEKSENLRILKGETWSQELGQLVRYGEQIGLVNVQIDDSEVHDIQGKSNVHDIQGKSKNRVQSEFPQDRVQVEIAFPVNGQIMEINQESIILRTGVSYLGSSRGLIYVNNADIVETNQLLLVLKSQQLQTEDIVQGIPKIEQLFEARETQAGKIIRDTVHRRLEQLFVQRFLPFIQDQKCPHSRDAGLKACEVMEEILPQGQLFLVEKIIEAYANQGVHISEKHVEIVVREMTHRGKIYEGSGSGLLPGEIVPLCSIRRFNREQALTTHPRYILYHPVVLGITKSVLHSESFLLAASFQEVSRVLVRSALSGKTDFLKGLHENVIVSRPISSGTGLLRI
jgi:hypothetical protein